MYLKLYSIYCTLKCYLDTLMCKVMALLTFWTSYCPFSDKFLDAPTTKPLLCTRACRNTFFININTGADRLEQTVYTQIRHCKMQYQVMVYTICHSYSSVFDKSTGSKMDLSNF